MKESRVVIVGGGFGGIQAALRLGRKQLKNTRITLLSDRTHFEYHGVLYRVATGKTPLEVCVPIRDIIRGEAVETVTDRVVSVDTEHQIVSGESGSRYPYDFLVLALGSETTYFDIPGLREFSFGVKSADEALRLKRHIHEVFASCDVLDPRDRACSAHIIVIGGGATGVEVAGELTSYARIVAKRHGVDPDAVVVDLVEAAPRILPSFPESFSELVAFRLRSLGVNILVGQTVTEQEVAEIHLKDMEMKTKTVVWTAGVRPHRLYTSLPGVTRDRSGRIMVGGTLEVEGLPGVFVLGDAASTPYAGMAQTAIADGKFTADIIADTLSGKNHASSYLPKAPVYILPVGSGWAAVRFGNTEFSGRIGWWFRRLFDFLVYTMFLPFPKAVAAFRESGSSCESCEVCSDVSKK